MFCWRMQGPRRKRLKKQNGSMTFFWKNAWRRNANGWTSCRIGLRGGLRVKQREEEQSPDFPLAMAANHQSELSIPSPIDKKPNGVESPPHSVAEVELPVYRKSWEEAM